MSSPREWVFPLPLIQTTLSAMADFTERCTVAVFGTRDDREPLLIGSGTLLAIRGAYFLLTAHHVLAQGMRLGRSTPPEYVELAHSIGDSDHPAIVHEPVCWAAGPFDLGATRVGAATVKDNTSVPLNVSQLARECVGSKNDLYFVHGWPGSASRWLFDGVAYKSHPHGGWLVESGWESFDPDLHLALDYPLGNLMDEHGRLSAGPLPHGMSGAALWKSNLLGNEHSWHPELAQVVGVVHRWDQEGQCLVATRIEYVRDFLLYALRQEFAYARWQDRGSPPLDDWADWFAAESAIPELEDDSGGPENV